MPARRIAPYGSWTSPITARMIVADTVSFNEVALCGDDVLWVEMRPHDGGRYVLVRQPAGGDPHDVTPPGFNVRTRVHEYGGAPYTVVEGGVCFANFADQRLYWQPFGERPRAISPAQPFRFADGHLDPRTGRLVCVREDHTGSGEPVNTLVAKDLGSPDDGGTVIASGRDFYAAPRFSPDGKWLAWLQWSHPNMPWDGTDLCLAETRPAGALGEVRRVAGGPRESVVQPEWSPDGVLHFISDRSGWWNLYRWAGGRAEPLCEREAEFAQPLWRLGMSSYGFESADRLWCVFTEAGRQQLARLDTRSRALEPVETAYTSFSCLQVGPAGAAFVAGSPRAPSVVARLDLATRDVHVLRPSSTTDLPPTCFSIPQTITFPTEDGRSAHGYFYPPANPDYEPPAGELPPLLVKSHGGPTASASSDFNLKIQYWTSRGFAVLDVNYGGSTGYGRAYRERLRGQWGVVDVDDCVNGALHLVRQELVDGNRLAIDGGSAGGYTTLNALTFRDVFHAGASLYGVSDLAVLAADTHKFESRYLDSLIGPYPERADLYAERSAIHHVDRLSCPVIFFQGDEDEIVPPNQAERMVDALRRKGLPVAYLLFEGEQHGFRKAKNIMRVLEAEFYFFARVFGFEPADDIPPVEIWNL